MLSIAVINGPNLNLIGTREPEVYGSISMNEYLEALKNEFSDISFHFYQSNVEGELINYLQECDGKISGIILNAGAYTHTSIAIGDAIAAIKTPVVEVHISNVYAREDFRKNSFIASKCVGSITGLGLDGYRLAVLHFLKKLTSEAS